MAIEISKHSSMEDYIDLSVGDKVKVRVVGNEYLGTIIGVSRYFYRVTWHGLISEDYAPMTLFRRHDAMNALNLMTTEKYYCYRLQKITESVDTNTASV